jgi:hypothetical protein
MAATNQPTSSAAAVGLEPSLSTKFSIPHSSTMFTGYLSTKALVAFAGVALASVATVTTLSSKAPQPKPTAKAEPKPTAQAESKPTAKAESKPTAKAEPKPDKPAATELRSHNGEVLINGWRYSIERGLSPLIAKGSAGNFPEAVTVDGQVYERFGSGAGAFLPSYVPKGRFSHAPAMPKSLPAGQQHEEWTFDQGRGRGTRDTRHYSLPGGSGFSERVTEHWEDSQTQR